MIVKIGFCTSKWWVSCSQIATNLLQQCGLALVAGLDPPSTSPYDLDLALTPKPGEGGAVGVPLKLAEKVAA